jgi:ribonuclease HI
MRATVLTDASYDHTKRVGGWSAWVRIDHHPLPIKGYGTFRGNVRNSTEAEVMAALNGLYIASNRGSTEALVRSDCMAVEQLIQGQTNAENLVALWREAMASAWGVRFQLITSRHVKGHADPNRHKAGWVNNWCDQHARKGLHAARKGRHFINLGEDA